MGQKDYWVTNICNMNVSLADLNLTIKAYCSVNLLDHKHYSYTFEQLESSRTSGSIAKKRNRIVVRDIAPKVLKTDVQFLKDAYIPSKIKSLYEIKTENYEELAVTDEQFAEDNAELADIDTKPMIIKDQK